ncbi:hypothetical protein G9464_17275 [Halostella sp. JP-L12]|uniref:hypothetical protein n=1 Tax=Halostella TaxID=1843185 RepID=UPI000EF7AF40|nr:MULTISPECIES: hypothetical protein [Halostella]NHN49326.1 hypothetical protein [Halostella sp. JP-L12]
MDSFATPSADAIYPDVLFAIAPANTSGRGASIEDIHRRFRKCYGRDVDLTAIVEAVDNGIEEGYITVEKHGYQLTIDGLECSESHLRWLGHQWDDVAPWEDGDKVVVERRQVASDITGTIDA